MKFKKGDIVKCNNERYPNSKEDIYIILDNYNTFLLLTEGIYYSGRNDGSCFDLLTSIFREDDEV